MAFAAGEIEAIFKMRDQLTKELKRVTSGLRQAGKAAQQVGRQFEQVGTKVQSAGTAMLPFSAALAAGAAAAFKFGNDFDVSMTKIITLVGIGADEVDGMRQVVLDLAGATAKAPQELADALFVVTSAGARGAEALEILEQAAKASAVGLGDTADIARAVTAALTAYGGENLTAAQATNVLFKTVREGNLNASELAGSLGSVIGIASEMGVSFGDLGAVVATYTRLGVGADEATTGLRAVLTSLLAPGGAAQKALEGVGLSAAGLRRQIKDEGLPATLVGLAKAFKGNTEALAGVIPNVRALSTVLGVAGGQSESFLKIAKSINEENDVLADSMLTVAETVDFKFNKSLVNLQKIAISTFEAFKGQFVFVIEGFTKIVGAVQKAVDILELLSPTAKNVVAGLVAFGAVAAPALIVAGSAIRVIGFALQGLGAVAGITTISFAGLSAVLFPLAIAVGLAVAAFAIWKADLPIVNAALDKVSGAIEITRQNIEILTARLFGVSDASRLATREAQAFREGLGSMATVAERLAEQLGGANLIGSMEVLEGLMVNLAQQGLLNADAMKTLADRAQELQAGGQKLTTGLARVVAEMDRQGVSADNAAAALLRETAAAADATAAAAELTKSQEEINAAFTTLGFTTIPEVTQELKLLEAVERKAIAAGTAERDVAALLRDAYDELAERAKASGLSIDALSAAVDRNRGTIKNTIPVLTTLGGVMEGFGETMKGTKDNVEGLSQSVLDARAKAAAMTDAYKLLGVTTSSSLTEARIKAEAAFNLIKESGMATRQEVQVAMMALSASIEAETGRAATFGSQAFQLMSTSVQGSFAQMLAGTKSFADGFTDIWNSVKAGFLGGLTEMLGGFLGKFIPGMNQGFSSLSGTASTALGGGGGGVGGIFGGTFGEGGKLAGIMGGFGPLAGGLLTGGLLALAPLAAKALVPLGKAIFGGLKKVGGFFKGLFGGVSAEELGGREIAAQFTATAAAILNDAQRIEAGNEGWKIDVIAVRDAYLALGLSEEQAEADVKAIWDATAKGPEATQAAVEKVIGPMTEALQLAETVGAPSVQALRDAIQESLGAGILTIDELKVKFGEELPAAIAEMGDAVTVVQEQLVATGETTKEAAGVMAEAVAAVGENMLEVGKTTADVTAGMTKNAQMATDTFVQGTDDIQVGLGLVKDSSDDLLEGIQILSGGAQGEFAAIQGTIGQTGQLSDELLDKIRALDAQDVVIDISFDVEKFPKLPGGGFVSTEIESFRHGGIVRRPTLGLLGESGPEAVIPLGGGAGGGGGGEVTVNVTISALDGADVKRVFDKQIMPLLVKTLRGNRAQGRTDMRDAMNVSEEKR